MKRKWLLITALVVVLAPAIFALPTNNIVLDEGGYTNLLIAIEDGIEEDDAIINGLAEMFTKGSATLFKATKNLVYFRSITILVPLNWIHGSYDRADTEAFENANVKVIQNSTDMTDKPSVTQFEAECGKQGLEMRLTPRYITNKTFAENNYGKRDKTLVRLWAKLRWGVFDEHYKDADLVKAFYRIPNHINYEVTRCSAEIKGAYINVKNSVPCLLNHVGQLPSHCEFVPEEGQTATASLMFDTGGYDIPSVAHFCYNDTNSPEDFHNRFPDNLQNLKCNRQSVWAVILNSTDMTGRVALPVTTITTPEIRVVRHGEVRRVVLVLDISGSMGGGKFLSMIQASTNYLQYIVPDGVFVGIVAFESSSDELSGLVEITDHGRMELVSALPTVASGGTCIGCGIETAIDILQRKNKEDSNGAYIILLSDGGENISPYIRDTLSLIDDSGVIIDTIAFTEKADLQLQDISERTAGYAEVCSLRSRVGCVNSAFIISVSKRPQIFPPSLITHVSLIDTIPASQRKVFDFAIDSSAGNGMIMTIAWTLTSYNIQASARSPSGNVVDDNNERYVEDSAINMITIQVDNAEEGIWNLEIINNSTVNATVGISVNSRPRLTTNKPPVVNAFIGSRHIDVDQKPYVEIYAHVHINYEPVLEADVIAQMESASGDSHTIQLRDNGTGSDLFSNDGIYSAYFLEFTTNGQYGVEVYVNGSTHQGSNVNTTGGRFRRDAEAPFSLFTRTTSGGSFQVEGYVPGSTVDILAPSKISDFRSVNATYDQDRRVEFMWTAVGDDLDHGTASHYELRYSTDFDTILYNWAACTEIQASDILVGRLSPVAPSFTTESVTVVLPDNHLNVTYYFAIRALDEANNVGSLSNIVTVVPRPPPPVVTTTNPPSTTMTELSTSVPAMTNASPTESTVPLSPVPPTNDALITKSAEPSSTAPATPSKGSLTKIPPSQDKPSSLPSLTLALIISISFVFGFLLLLAAILGLYEFRVCRRSRFKLHIGETAYLGRSNVSTNDSVVVVSCKNPTFNSEV